MSAKPKRSFGGPKHPVALGILVVVAVGLIIGNVALVNASNAYVPWSQVDATVVGGPIAPEAFLTTATVYLDDENGTAYYEDVFERSDTQCSTYTDEYGDTYEDCWTEYWTEYECYADLDLRWTVNGTEHQAWEYSPTLYDSSPCLSAIEDVFPNGTNLTIAVDPNDPSSHQAFELALMTEVDEDHQGFRTGYRESSHLEWGGYGRAVLVTTCEMDAAVAYTFDGEEYVRDIWGGSPVTEGWGSSCSHGLRRNVRTWKHRDGDGRHRKPVRGGVGRPHHRSGRVHRHRHVLFGHHLPRGLRVDRQRRHGPTMGCSHSPSQPIRSPSFGPPPVPWAPPPQASRACAPFLQVERVKSQVQRRQPVQRWWRSEQRRRWPQRRWRSKRRWRTRSSLTINLRNVRP